jgi:hypothetical protein
MMSKDPPAAALTPQDAEMAENAHKMRINFFISPISFPRLPQKNVL